jgi:hypothetical protein
MKKVMMLAVLVVLSGCTRPDHTRALLESQGYTDVDAGGYSYFGCSEDDFFRTKFTATAPNGQPVKGVVCKGVFKGATVRFD